MWKKTLAVVVLLALVASMLCACTPAKPVFKSFCWGDSKETVMKVEGFPDDSGKVTDSPAEYIVYYNRELLGREVALAYYFADNKLYEVRYLVNSGFYVPNDMGNLDYDVSWALAYETYLEYESLLQQKYGTPTFRMHDFMLDQGIDLNSFSPSEKYTSYMIMMRINGGVRTNFVTDESSIMLHMTETYDDRVYQISISYISEEYQPDAYTDNDLI